MHSKKIIIIGGGAAGLVAAEQLSATCQVHIYEKGKTIGRKFLVAGNGGFNLTNAAVDKDLYAKYTKHPILQAALQRFDSQAMRVWLEGLGVPTFVGSSGRVFPKKGIKPIQVLQKIKDKLVANGVQIHSKHEFIGFNAAQQPIIRHQEQHLVLEADAYIFALGGASWSVTGSNMKWLNYFEQTSSIEVLKEQYFKAIKTIFTSYDFSDYEVMHQSLEVMTAPQDWQEEEESKFIVWFNS